MSSNKLPQRPLFASLPLHESDPPFSAWGLYGPDDQLGALNLLTDECVMEATKEIKSGMRVGLNLPLNVPSPPSHGRLPFTHKVVHKAPRNVHDDVVEMNTQVGYIMMEAVETGKLIMTKCSTQWDGFRHYGYQTENVCYNGVAIPEISGLNAGLKLGIQCNRRGFLSTSW